MSAIRETLPLLSDEIQKQIQSRYQVVKARGKASIISLVKYLKALGTLPRVMHDSDSGGPGQRSSTVRLLSAVPTRALGGLGAESRGSTWLPSASQR